MSAPNLVNAPDVLVERWRKGISNLSPATAKLLEPARAATNDRIRLDVSPGAKSFHIAVYSEFGGKRGQPSLHAKLFLERFPERKPLYGHSVPTFEIPATDFPCLLLFAAWPQTQIEFASANAFTLFSYRIASFAANTENAARVAHYRETKELPPLPANYHDNAERPLSPYQTVGVVASLPASGYALFMEQGTGKTPAAIRRAMIKAHEVYCKEKRMFRWIIGCPKNVRMNWLEEINKFATVPGKATIFKGDKFARMGILVEALKHEEDCEFTAIITSLDLMRRSEGYLANPWSDAIGWDEVTLDESHYIKDSSTKRAESMMVYRDNSRSRCILTGSPVCNSVKDLWSQLEFLEEGCSGFESADAFRNYYTPYWNEQNPVMENLPVLHEKLSRCAYFVTKKEALPDLPEKTYDVNEVYMSKEQAAVYRSLAEQLAAEMDEAISSLRGKDARVTINHILVQLLRLAQVTSGFVTLDQEYDEEGSPRYENRIRWFDRNPKLEALMELLAEKKPHQKTIVAACFVPDVTRISEELAMRGYRHAVIYGKTSEADRQQAMRQFNENPQVQVLVGNPSTMREGVNLWGYNPEWIGTDKDAGTNCDHMIFYSQNWSLVNRIQTEDRAHRRGTRTSVRYTDLVVPSTIDQMIRERVVLKKLVADKVQDVSEICKALKSMVGESDDE